MKEITNSQVANNSSTISNSKNENNPNNILKRIRIESTIISFIVGFLASVLASYIYENYLK